MRASVGSGELPAAQALKLAPEFGKDPEPEVVSGALALVRLLPAEQLPREVEANREAFIRTVFGARARQLGWTPKSGERDGEDLLRRELVPFVASAGMDRELIAEAEKLAREWLQKRKVWTTGCSGRCCRWLHSSATGRCSIRSWRRRRPKPTRPSART